MPALPAVPGTLQLAYTTTVSGTTHPLVNRIHFHYTGTAPTPAQLLSFATTALTAWSSALSPLCGTDKIFSGLDVIDLSSVTSATAVVTGAVAGVRTGGELPADVAMVLSATIARRYRGGHPRSYLPVGTDTDVDTARLWASSFGAAVLTAWSGFVTAIEGAGWTGAGTIAPVNVSYYAGFTNVVPAGKRAYSVPTLRVGGPLVDLITGYVARLPFGTQRRRLAA
jgi:hypothetical protein